MALDIDELNSPLRNYLRIVNPIELERILETGIILPSNRDDWGYPPDTVSFHFVADILPFHYVLSYIEDTFSETNNNCGLIYFRDKILAFQKDTSAQDEFMSVVHYGPLNIKSYGFKIFEISPKELMNLEVI